MSPLEDNAFLLAPWEWPHPRGCHHGARGRARPDAIASIEVDGKQRHFLLRVQQNALFFREVERGQDFIFCLLSPLEKTSNEAEYWKTQPEFLVQWFEAEFEAGNFGRVVVQEDFQFIFGTFVFIFGADGRAMAREPWDDAGIFFRWQPFEGLTPKSLLDWPQTDFLGAVALLEKVGQYERQRNKPKDELYSGLASREVPDEVLKADKELSWLCGSLKELRQLTSWAAHRFIQPWPDDEDLVFIYYGESVYGQAAFCGVNGSTSPETVERLRPICELFLDFNTPIGHEWEFQDMRGARLSWAPANHYVSFKVEPPTAHQRLEALHNLRAWLQGKAPKNEIERLLSELEASKDA